MPEIPLWLHQWGMVIPCNSGYVYELQTGGLRCRHPVIEGVYVPFYFDVDYKPRNDLPPIKPIYRNIIPVYHNSTNMRIYHRSKESKAFWTAVKRTLGFDFVITKPPIGYYEDEGLMWVKLKKGTNKYIWDYYSRMVEGKTVAIVYPNSD